MVKTIVFLFTNSKTYKEYLVYFPWEALRNKKIIVLKSNNNAQLKSGESAFKLCGFTSKLNIFIQYCELWRRRESTITYLFQANVYFGYIKGMPKLFLSLEKRFRFLERVFIRSCANLFLINFLNFILKLLFLLETKRLKFDIKNVDLFVLPFTGGLSPEWNFLVWLGNKYHIPTLGIQENWDNVSSKMFLTQHPSHFATWGKQSSSHLRTIHKFQGSLTEIGCLRIQPFYNFRSGLNQNHTSHERASDSKRLRNIIIIGTGNGYDDLTLIKGLSNYFLNNPTNDLSNFRILYRPHPFNTSDIQQQNLDRIRKVPIVQVLSNELFHEERIDQIINAVCVISFYSTVILEALILDKICIIPDFLVRNPNNDQIKLMDDLPHYAGLSTFKKLIIPNNFDELIKYIEISSNLNLESNSLSILDWYCSNSDTKNLLVHIIRNEILSMR